MKTVTPISSSSRRWIPPLLLPSLAALPGCQRAPSISVVGSFFPVWIFCVVAGIVVAALVHTLFVRLELEKEIMPAVLVYPCIAASFAVTLWLVFFS